MQYSLKDLTQLHTYTPDRLRALLMRAQDDIVFFHSVINSLNCGIILFDHNGEIQFINRYGEVLINNNGIVTTTIWELFQSAEMEKKLHAAIKGTLQIKGDIISINVFAGITHLIFSLFPRLKEDIIVGWIINFQDYTEQYQQQGKMRRQDYLKSITNISSSIAHELRNPLGAISIHLQLIRKKISALDANSHHLAETVKDRKSLFNHIDTIEEEIENMNNIIGLFLNNMKIGSTEYLQQDLNTLIEGFKKFIEPDLSSHNIICTTILEKNLPLVMISRPSITHVLLNLVKNSIEVLHDGGEITLRTYSKDAYVYISITDTGSPISQEVQESMFNPYYTTKEQGSGIGLAISDRIMQLHHGRIIFDKDHTDGTTFILEFSRMADEHCFIADEANHGE